MSCSDWETLSRLKRDIRRRCAKSATTGWLASLRFFLKEPQYQTLFWHRLAEAAGQNPLGSLLRRISLRSSRRTGLEILTPSLGGGVIMPHWGRIILNAESIGEDLYVFQNVTVGNNYTTGRPTIGSGVFLGAGATVLGKVMIGDNVIIAAGSIVVDDIPPNSLVAGNPARVVRSIPEDEITRMIGY